MVKKTKKIKGLNSTRFSKAHLLAFALVFAGIGGYFIYQSFAAYSLPTRSVTLPGNSGLTAYWLTHDSPNRQTVGDGISRDKHSVIRWGSGGVYEGRKTYAIFGFRLLDGAPGRMYDFHTQPNDVGGWYPPCSGGGVAPLAMDYWGDSRGLQMVTQPEDYCSTHQTGSGPYHHTIFSQSEMEAKRGQWVWLWAEIDWGRRDLPTKGGLKIWVAGESTPRVNVSGINTHYPNENQATFWEGQYHCCGSSGTQKVEIAATRFGTTPQKAYEDTPTLYVAEPAGVPNGTSTVIASRSSTEAGIPLSLQWANPPPPPPTGSVIFADSFESGDLASGWGSQHEYTPDRLKVVGPEAGVSPRDGTKMLRSEMRYNEPASWCSTCNVSSVQHGTHFRLGSEQYMGWSQYLPNGYSHVPNHLANNFVEWHADASMSQAPFHITIDGYKNPPQYMVDLHTAATGYTPVFQKNIGNVAYGRWEDFVLRIKWSQGADGIYQAWRNGTLVHDYRGPTWGTQNSVYAIVGQYRANHNATSIAYFDSFKLGTSYASVDPAAGTTPPPPPAPTITSSINNGDSIPAGTTWTVSVSPTPSLVELWADGVKLVDDSTAPYSTVLNLAPGAHQIGICTTISGQRTCTNNVSNGVFANITVTAAAPTPTWTSSIASGATIPSGTTWSATVSPVPSSVEFWATPNPSGPDNLLKTDNTSPYDVVLNLPAGNYILGVCAYHSGIRTCFNDRKSVTITTPTVPPHIAAADLNNDGSVNILDLSILLGHYNTTNPAADINGDGQVNVTDLSLLLNRYQ